MPDDNVSKIKDRVDVVDLVGSYLKLQKAGVNYKAKCPFHNEKSPSFFVSPERQTWRCFGCSVGGDIFSFVQQIEGVEFPEALRTLAARAGVELTRFAPANPEYHNAKARLYEICELGAKFYQKQLHESATGKTALKYLKDREMSDESIAKFRIGWAPDTWTALTDFLIKKYQAKDIFDSGLMAKKEAMPTGRQGGGQYDRFRSRIMFPVFDLNGAVVGFAGRIFENEKRKTKNEKQEEPAKYINTPQTPIYDKGRLLYGLNFAKMDIRKADKCLVVEGNVDVIMSHQAGVTHTVASSGTALTDGHLKIIKRYSDNLDLCFDADSAGTMATDRGVDLALAHGFNVGILAINEKGVKDAADYVAKHGAKWAEYAKKASKPFMEFYVAASRAAHDLATAIGKKLFAQKLFPLVASIANVVERSHWITELSTLLKLKEDVIQKEIAAIKPKAVYVDEQRITNNEKRPALDIYEESLLSLILKKPALADTLTEEERAYIPNPTPEQKELAAMKADESWKDFDDQALDNELKKLISFLKKRTISAQLQNLEYEIKQAEKEGDKEAIARLSKKFKEISSKL